MTDLAETPVAILAGGLATRLGPISERIPKALVDVAGQPFVVHQLELLRGAGFLRVVLCVGHLGDQIEALLGTGAGVGLALAYCHDGETLLGTGGALRKALPLLTERFFVLYGDSYLEMDYNAMLEDADRRGAEALMAVYRNEGRWERSNVLFADGRVQSYDKRHPADGARHVDHGISVLTRQVVQGLPERARADLADLLGTLAAEGLLLGHEVKDRFYEIGSPAGLEDLRRHLSSHVLRG